MIVTSLPGGRSHAEREQMLAAVEGAVVAFGRDHKFYGREVEDVLQTVRLEVWKATQTFDPRHSGKWSTYAVGVVKMTVRRILADGQRYAEPVTQMIDGSEGQFAGREPEPLDAVVAAEEAGGLTDEDMEPFVRLFTAAALAGKLAKLDPPAPPQRVETRAQKVRRLARAGRSVAEIVAEVGLKIWSVRHCLAVPVRRHRPGYTAVGVSDEQLVADMLAAPPLPSDTPPKQPKAAKLFDRPMHTDIMAGLSVADVAAKYNRRVAAVRQHCRDVIRLWRPEYTTWRQTDAAVLALYRECVASAVPPTEPPPSVGLRKLVEMVVIDRMTPAEIADRIGWRVGIVRRNLQQANVRLTGKPFPKEMTEKGRKEAEKAAAGLTDTPAAADRRRAKKASAARLAAHLDAAKARAASPAPEPAAVAA